MEINTSVQISDQYAKHIIICYDCIIFKFNILKLFYKIMFNGTCISSRLATLGGLDLLDYTS